MTPAISAIPAVAGAMPDAAVAATAVPAHVEYVLRLGDSSLILGQRLSEWCGHGPVLEEDIALANTALDLLGQARLLLTHAGALEGRGRDEDALAYRRNEDEFRNVTLVELPNGDFGQTVLRNLLVTGWQLPLWQGLAASKDAQLAAIAAKSLKETRYHFQHAADWTERLGDGTDESNRRMRAALETLWPYVDELFADDAVDTNVAAHGVGVASSSLRPAWERLVLPVLRAATLDVPAPRTFRSAGKAGRHSEHLSWLLAEMQQLQRAYPGAQW